MRFLFWNTHNTKDINSILCGMIVEQKANIVILAEYEDIIEDLIYNLDLKGVRMNVYPSIGCDRLIILGNTKDIRQSRQSKYYSMQIIKNDMLLCGVHLPSQMWADERTQTLAFQSVVRDIELAEEDGGIDKTIVVGDFNQKHNQSRTFLFLLKRFLYLFYQGINILCLYKESFSSIDFQTVIDIIISIIFQSNFRSFFGISVECYR